MYDNDYFKEVMGNQYKEDDLFENSYNKKNHDYVVITPNRLMGVNDTNLNQNKDSNKNQISNTNSVENNNQSEWYTKTANNEKEISNSIKKVENKIENIEKKIEVPLKEAENKMEKPMKKAEYKIKEEEQKVAEVSSNFKKDFEKLYPEIYKIIKPMIEVAINRNKDKGITNDIIEKIANEIYYAIEGYEGNNAILVSKNEENTVLYDLIKILLLNKVASKINDNINNDKNNTEKLDDNRKIGENKNMNINNFNVTSERKVANNPNEKIGDNKNVTANQINTISEEKEINHFNEQVDDNKTIPVSNSNIIHEEKSENQQSNTSSISKVSYFDIPFPEDA